MIAVQALEKRTTELKQKEAQIAAMAERLEAMELRKIGGESLSFVATGE
jgi:hypothetical protein